MKKTIFLYSGEGTHNNQSRYKLLTNASSWEQIVDILNTKLHLNLEDLWQQEIGRHRCPYSPLLTVITQICLADIWRKWGYLPDVIIGHSTGELAAAYEAGLYSLESILELALNIGRVAANLEGAMGHGWLTDTKMEQITINISSVNFQEQLHKHVTLSGYTEEMDDFFSQHPDFVKMKLPHPWHHPDYIRFIDKLPLISSEKAHKEKFVSGVTTRFETRLKDDHWHKWFVHRIDFVKSIQTIKDRYDDDHLDIIEIGFHPVLSKACETFQNYTYVSSMFRGEDDIEYILFQRRKLDQDVLLIGVRETIEAFKSQLDFDIPLSYQNFTSMDFVHLAAALCPYFPALAPQDFYRYKTINQLIERFGRSGEILLSAGRNLKRCDVVISAMSCRLPSFVETLPQFWEMLMSKTDQVEGESGRGQTEAGFLNSAVSRFDHQYFNISQAEARTMDPQQILALELTEMLFLDAGIDPQKLDKQRVGVYIGAWNQEYHGDSSSVYYPTGINASIIAGRISYHYDFRGPSWVSNTACSSSLIAVHYAVKDIEAGRIDYAVAGGVNMLLDEAFTVSMQHSGFLSKDFRCKTFDDSANGYVRAEGGALVLLANKELVTKYYARVIGTAINQNGGRAQVITAPHPEAQEELIAAACQDAGIMPQEIAYLECHGTGTKIGDPIEMTAIQNTVGRERGDTLYVGSIKSNLGHLESAAGIAGTIKAVAALNHGIIPPNLHFSTPNQFIDFKSYPISVVSEATPIAHEAVAGISSFGFGGANAHIIIKGAEEKVCKKIQPVQIPFDRLQAASLDTYLKLIESELCPSLKEAAPENTGTDIRQRIQAHLFKVTGISEIDPDLALLDQGLDSMSATELFNHLQEEFKIEIDPEILFDNPLFDQFAAKIKHMINSQPEKKIEDGFTKDNIDQLVAELFFQLTGIKEIDPEVELTDQGLDSMSGAELISQMESGLKIEIGPEILFEYPLREQFVEQIYTLVNQKQT